jgi:hypothetical protein
MELKNQLVAGNEEELFFNIIDEESVQQEMLCNSMGCG